MFYKKTISKQLYLKRTYLQDASDKENNDGTESYDAATTTSDQVDAISTDVSLSESMTFDSCSLNEYPELPTTPEEVSAQTTGASNTDTLTNGKHEEDSSSTTTTLCDDQSTTVTSTSTTNNGVSSTTLPSKLDKLEKLDWDEIDDLLQVERRVSEKDKVYETMPVRLPSASPQNSSSSTPTSDSSKTVSNQNSTDSTNIEEVSPSKTSQSSTTTSSASSSSTTTSSDNFLTATASLNTTTTGETSTNANTTTSTTVDNYETSDDATLKPMDFEDFKRSVHQDYVNGANSFQEHNDDTLKRNQPIDPSRIHDSLKLYNAAENPMSKSFNCEHALRTIDASLINDTLSLKNHEGGSPLKRSPYALQKSGSAQAQLMVPNGRFEKGINRSKSGPSCVVYSSSDDDDDSTLKPRLRRETAEGDGIMQISATIRKSDIPPKFIQIKMNCYPKEGASDCDSSRQDNAQSTTSQSGAAAGDELTQTEELYTASVGSHQNHRNSHHLDNDDQPLHVTEDGVVLRRPPRTGAAAIKRRSGNRR